jgi:LDH2 family malate/lactate/ureidoglycolate dehydrogenase
MAVRGEKAPEGWLIKPDGSWSNDPLAVHKREAKPVAFGFPYSEYKGYGLSVIVEALAGGIGSGCSLDETGFGHSFTVIDPTGFCSLEEFTGRIEAMIDYLKSSRRRPGFEEILYPGEPEWREAEKRKQLGIFVDDQWWENITRTAKELEVDIENILKDGYL